MTSGVPQAERRRGPWKHLGGSVREGWPDARGDHYSPTRTSSGTLAKANTRESRKGGTKKDRMLEYARRQSNGDKRRETNDPPPPSGTR